MSTFSSNLRIELITTGTQAGTWGNTTNTNLGTILENSIAGYATVSVIASAQAFTANDGAADEARMAMLRLTTTTGAAFAVYAPPVSKQYIIWNNSGYTATIYNSTVTGNTTAAGTGVAIADGNKVMVWSNGTNFYAVEVQNIAGTLPIASGGTGQTTANAAFNALAPSQASASGKYLKSDGTNTSWDQLDISTGDITGTLPVANGGTGATSTATAPFALKGANSDITSLSGLTTPLSVAQGGVGAATLTANSVLLGNGTSALQAVAPGTSGNVLTSNGTTWASTTPASSYSGLNTQVFTSSGTFTVPSGITSVQVAVFGGGGGSAGAAGTPPEAYSGGLGGNGGAGIALITGLTPGASITVTVGGGGNGTSSSSTSSSSGGNGSTSSFGSYATATGGAGGGGQNYQGTGGGTGANGTFSTTGTVLRKGGASTGPTYYSNYGRAMGMTFGGAGPGDGGGGGGMSGGGAGGAGNTSYGGIATGPGSNGSNNSGYSGGAGGGTSGGSGGSPYTSGYGGGGGGGTGGVIVFW